MFILLCSTSDDIPDVDQVRYLLQKVKEIRQRKLDSGLHQLDTRPMDVSA